MGTTRLEAFSDGVIAILITIMVLEMHVPHGEDLHALLPLWPVFLSYILSFTYMGIYWNNHHHLFQTCERVTAGILWSNLHLLFWLSLVPFTTGWMGENKFASIPMAVYGFVMLMCALAWILLQTQIIKAQGNDALLKKAIGSDWKGKASGVLYFAAIGMGFISHWAAFLLYTTVAALWFIPDRRIERTLAEQTH